MMHPLTGKGSMVMDGRESAVPTAVKATTARGWSVFSACPAVDRGLSE
jgi:hypothetical protein